MWTFMENTDTQSIPTPLYGQDIKVQFFIVYILNGYRVTYTYAICEFFYKMNKLDIGLVLKI